MDEAIRPNKHRLITIAFNPPDGWPQTTAVGDANDALTIYFLCGPQSQKAQYIARDNRVSLMISGCVRTNGDHWFIDGSQSRASAGCYRDLESDRSAYEALSRVCGHSVSPDQIVIVKVLPKVISVLDYSKAFARGLTELPYGKEDYPCVFSCRLTAPRAQTGLWRTRLRLLRDAPMPKSF